MKTTLKTRSIDYVTVMSVIYASGFEFKPVDVYPEVHALSRVIQGTIETLQHHLMLSYLFLGEGAGVYSNFFFDWAFTATCLNNLDKPFLHVPTLFG